MGFLESLILGIVQGLTEFLPISSSGHLTLVQHLFGYSGSESNFAFGVLLHLGTLVAVVIVYYKLIWDLIKEMGLAIKDIFTGKFSFKLSKMTTKRRMLIMMILSEAFLLALFIPIGGKSLMDISEIIADGNHMLIVGIGFLITSALLLVSYFTTKAGGKHAKTHKDATVKDAVCIGAAQVVAATVAGVSRSGSTISTGLICGLDREYMTAYSFILSIPAILAAVITQSVDVAKEGFNISLGSAAVGFIAAIVCGVVAIKFLQWIIKKDYYNWFGYYCGVLGILVIIMTIVEKTNGVDNIVQLFG